MVLINCQLILICHAWRSWKIFTKSILPEIFYGRIWFKIIEQRLKNSYNKYYETSIIAISPKGWRNIDEIFICFIAENISGERSNRKRCISKTDLWKAVLIFPDGQLQENDARKRKFVRCKINFYGGTFTYNHILFVYLRNTEYETGRRSICKTILTTVIIITVTFVRIWPPIITCSYHIMSVLTPDLCLSLYFIKKAT